MTHFNKLFGLFNIVLVHLKADCATSRQENFRSYMQFGFTSNQRNFGRLSSAEKIKMKHQNEIIKRRAARKAMLTKESWTAVDLGAAVQSFYFEDCATNLFLFSSLDFLLTQARSSIDQLSSEFPNFTTLPQAICMFFCEIAGGEHCLLWSVSLKDCGWRFTWLKKP